MKQKSSTGRLGIRLFLILFLAFAFGFAGDLLPQGAGNMQIAIPGGEHALNLYRFAGNTAWLQMNDKHNWMVVSGGSGNSWGELRRYWDPFGVHTNRLTFSGQKHVSATKTFYGAITYNIDSRTGVNRAIELEPYALDPFVLCDSTQGNFNYNGPTVVIAFSHQLFPHLWWGIGLNYAIYRGLKEKYSMPEIIRRTIQTDFSLAYMLGDRWAIGLSFRPYDIRDLTKIVQQPDGTEPVVFRYRGEFEFTSVTSKDDRTAIYRGMEISPQVMFRGQSIKGIISAGYYYRWHEVYDNVHLRKYDGYYQGKHYFFDTAWRWFMEHSGQSVLTFRYGFRYIQDWAEEPLRKFAIYRSFHRMHDLTLGFSKHFNRFLTAFEAGYRYYLPNKKDYLAHVYREAPIKTVRYSMGGSYRFSVRWQAQAGLLWKKYSEPVIWHYFGDYSGVALTAGLAYKFKTYQIQVYTKIGHFWGREDGRDRRILDFFVRFKQFLN